MLFNSLTFLLFFAVVFSLFLCLRGAESRKNLLLLASYLFYASWSPPYVLLLLASTSVDWLLARAVWRSRSGRARRGYLSLSLVCNLALLGYFKYGDFLLRNFSALLTGLGVQYHPLHADIVLPIGISFYTFASLSYTIDVYRGEIDAHWRLRDYALFVSLFPHLVAGPIVRARVLLPQIETPKPPSSDQIGWGLVLFTLGLFGKVVLADSLFAPIVDQVYANSGRVSAADALAGVLGFSAQIYYDFAGYSTCAIGLALCFGFRFPDNFRFPYAARSFSDFWHRWHISLSSWLRDYLYVPLGGNRKGPTRTYVNLALTMLIGGLWHGASWMFVLWGGLHGLYLAVERRIGWAQGPGRSGVAAVLGVFLLVTLTWIPFRAPDLGVVWNILEGLTRFSSDSLLDPESLIAGPAGVAAMLYWQYRMRDSTLEALATRHGPLLQGSTIAACLISLFLCSGGDQRAFIYFQF
jgi:alginate O-acetyltransferase complex protein AlgI